MKVACVQETKLTTGSCTPKFPNYVAIRRDRPAGGGGGGILKLVHQSVEYFETQSPFNDNVTECTVIRVKLLDSFISIANIYVPPQSSCPPGFAASLRPLLASDSLIVGDINAHNEAWSLGNNDPRGDSLIDEIDAENFVALNNPDIPTRPPSNSSPDVALASVNIALNFEWSAIVALNSDHLPVAITLENDNPPSRLSNSYTSFRKANWSLFKDLTESQFSTLPLPTSCSEGEKVWRRVLTEASSRAIPAGYRKNVLPGLDIDSARLVQERDELRRRNPNDPSILDLNQRISAATAAAARQRWMEAVGKADKRSNSRHYWGFMAGLSGKRVRQAQNQPINFHNKTFTKRQSIANEFNKQYVNAMPFKKSKQSRKIFRKTKQNNQLDRTAVFFSPPQVIDAIRATKNSTAVGPNGLTALHLKHLGRNGIGFLTRLFNLSLQSADIPAIWKASIVVPVPKPGKPLDQGSSYRPISLLSPEVKVLERLLLPELAQSLTPNQTQHGFRARHSTVTALMPLVTTVARNFNEPKPASRTGLLSIDLSKAFDIIERDRLIAKINSTNLRPNLKRWLCAYMRDRKTRVRYQGVLSRWRKTKLGVPQGSVISPLLFNFFIADLEVEAADVNAGFADDLHSAASSPDLAVITGELNQAAGEMESWAAENGMAISAPKSTVNLFTPWTAQVNAQLPVQIDGVPVPMEKNPKLLGVVLDPTFTFSSHAIAIAKKASLRTNKILRALSDTAFGHDKECLLATYKAFIRSLFDYAAPIVFPNYSRTSIERLQKIQNRSLRLVLGCHSLTAIDHLHSECKELPVEQHLRLLSAQFLALCLQPDHPSHQYVTLDRGRRPMKETLRSKCLADVEPFLNDDGVVERGSYEAAKVGIHTKIVSETIDSLGPNRVLGRQPPPIDPTEVYLHRQIRSTLSQLRSSHCARLLSYQARIGSSPTDLCPDCSLEPHTTAHLFNCTARPTSLNPIDLWQNPWRVAHFLQSTPSFDFLPCAGPPPPPPRRCLRPRPPPEPPPGPPPPPRSPSPVFTPVSLPPSPFAFDGRGQPPPLMSQPVGPQALRYARSSQSGGDLFSSS